MDFMLPLPVPKASQLINHRQKIFSIGSCFTEHIGNALARLKFDVLQNPNGILFDPASVAGSLVSYTNGTRYIPEDLFELNEVWNSWYHHSRFSGVDKDAVLQGINRSQEGAYGFLKNAEWLIITLGSSFSYRLKRGSGHAGPFPGRSDLSEGSVANCHRGPAQWFEKHMMTIADTTAVLDNAIHQVAALNPDLKIIFTISPVRHIRDGVIQNNRSKARLLESVHDLVNKFDHLFYFPSYEIVIDVLRDYRFYSEDMVHPNYAATDYVLEEFIKTFMSSETAALITQIKKLNLAAKHRPAHSSTRAHQNFLAQNFEQTKALKEQYPFLDVEEELAYFSTGTRVEPA